jgi:hypothetical protein
MNYFKLLGLVFGLAAMLKPFYMHVLPWDEHAFIARAYTKRRPAWVVPVAVLGLALVALTWYVHFTAAVPYSPVLTILFSLTAVKGLTLLLDYERFQRWVAAMLAKDRGRGIVLVDLGAGAIGLAIVLLALFVY